MRCDKKWRGRRHKICLEKGSEEVTFSAKTWKTWSSQPHNVQKKNIPSSRRNKCKGPWTTRKTEPPSSVWALRKKASQHWSRGTPEALAGSSTDCQATAYNKLPSNKVKSKRQREDSIQRGALPLENKFTPAGKEPFLWVSFHFQSRPVPGTWGRKSSISKKNAHQND